MKDSGLFCVVLLMIVKTTNKLWTCEEDGVLINLLENDGLSVSAIATIMGRPYASIKGRIQTQGLACNHRYKKWTNDRNFFDVPNPVNSAWAGFIAADGSVRHHGGTCDMKIEINRDDDEYLKVFLKDIKSNNPIFYYDPKNGRRPAIITVRDRFWTKPLENHFGIVPRKTWCLDAPNIPENLWSYYISGFMDGDGCIRIDRDNRMVFDVGGASPKILEWIAEWSNQFHCKNTRIDKRKVYKHKQGHWNLHVRGESGVLAAHHIMSLPCRHMARKYNLVRNYLIANPKYNLSLPTLEEHQKLIII